MIYIATSPYSLKILQNFTSRYLDRNLISFVVYDYAVTRTFQVFDSFFNIKCSGYDVDSFFLNNSTNNDFLISFDCFHIFKQDVIDLFAGRSANFHPSPLPSYAGINPISWGLYQNSDYWAYTWHRMAGEIDAGPILMQNSFGLVENISQFQVMRICLMDGLKRLPAILDMLPNLQESPIIDTLHKPSYFSGSDFPSISYFSNASLNKLCKVIPFNPNPKWRWRFDINSVEFSAISLSSSFGEIILKKSFQFNDVVYYYAD